MRKLNRGVVTGYRLTSLSVLRRILEQFANWEGGVENSLNLTTAICCVHNATDLFKISHLINTLSDTNRWPLFFVCLVCSSRSSDKCKSWWPEIIDKDPLVSSLLLSYRWISESLIHHQIWLQGNVASFRQTVSVNQSIRPVPHQTILNPGDAFRSIREKFGFKMSC